MSRGNSGLDGSIYNVRSRSEDAGYAVRMLGGMSGGSSVIRKELIKRRP